ncbi:MAG: F0F1 ATP synthase subunit alpha, partial [bacterium]|nr:F0F1 ATP synthase subunit alpha [bacterium]
RPAINVGLSVSRVGGKAQAPAMKQTAGRLRLEMASYRELAAFAQFASDLDPATKAKLERGARITEILKQSQYKPMPIGEQVLVIWAVTHGAMDEVEVNRCHEWEERYLEFIRNTKKTLLAAVSAKKKIDEKLEKEIDKSFEEFKKVF